MPEKKLNVTVTKTRNGTSDYIQIASDDQISINIVLIADKIEVKDHRSLQDILASQKE